MRDRAWRVLTLTAFVLILSILYSQIAFAGCCVEDNNICLPADTTEQQGCTDTGGIYYDIPCEGDLLLGISPPPGCSLDTGCCCLENDQFVIGISEGLCLSSQQGGISYDSSADGCAEFCQIDGNDGGDQSDTSCASLGGFLCAPNDSPGSEIPNVDVSGNLICYDTPCSSEVESCEVLGGFVCSRGQACTSAWLDETQRCCYTGCEGATCVGMNGFWCSDGQQCETEDITADVMDYTGRQDPNQLCCYGASPADACVGTSACTPTSVLVEDYCNDGIDNDCDGKVDFSDVSSSDAFDDCGGVILGRVADQNNIGVGDVIVHAYNANGDIATGITRSSGDYTIYSVAAGIQRVEIVSSQYQSTPIQGVDVAKGKQVSNIDFQVVLRSSGTFYGKVLGIDGEPIKDATVRIIDSPHVALTDVLGNFVFNGLVTGEYKAFAFKTGYMKSSIFTFTGTSGSTTAHDFTLESFICEISKPVPVITSIGPLKGENHIELKWTIPNNCTPHEMKIYRCDDQFINCTREPIYALKGSITNGEAHEFVDRNLQWDKYFTYKVSALYSQGVSDAEASYSEAVEIYSGNLICRKRATTDQFCIVDENTDAGYYCDDENKLRQAYDEEGYRIIDCTPAELTCSETIGSIGQVQTLCINKVVCASDDRASPFGMFFTKETCQTDFDGAVRPCYYDNSRTNVDTCYDCKIDMTCADYKSGRSCEENVCEIIEAGTAAECEWEIVDEDLDTGVCKDTKRDLCGFCDNAINKVFGMCNQNTCSSLGDCFYVNAEEAGEPGSCKECSKVTCYDYIDEESCMPRGQPALNYETNEMLASSGDPCGIGTCLWMSVDEGKCVKDANGNGRNDCGPEDFSYVSTTFQSITCRNDRYAANTSVIMPTRFNSNENNITIAFLTYDFEWNVKQKAQDVWFCIEPEGTTRCSNVVIDYDKSPFDDESGMATFVFEGLEISPGVSRKIYHLAPGKNTLKYYSVDWANNLELIQEYDFYVDTIGPIIDISHFISPKLRQADKPQLSDVTIIATLDEPGKCAINLKGCDATGTCVSLDDGPSEIDSFIPQHHRTISNVEDGIYTAEVTCVDVLGNENVAEGDIVVDADPRAFNPRPKGAIDQNDITLSVDTVKEVDCRWSTNINALYDSIPSENIMAHSRQGTTYKHTASITLQESKPYVYYVVCNYAPVSRELVMFSLDQISPELDLQESWGEAFDFEKWHTDGNIYPVCYDEPSGGFGCGEITYCFADLESYKPEEEKQNCEPDVAVKQNGHIIADMPQRLCVVAKEKTENDMGGKESTVKCNDILVDKYPPLIDMTSFPTSTNTHMLHISGDIMDIHYMKSSWSMSAVQNQPSIERYIEEGPNTRVADFDFFADSSIRYTEEEKPIVSFLFRYSPESGQYYAATIDASNPQSHTMRIEKKTGTGQLQIIAEETLEFESGVKYPVHISAEEGELEFEFGDYTITTEDAEYLEHGYVGVQTYKAGDRFPTVSVSDIKLDDHDVFAENTLYVEKDGHLEVELATRSSFETSVTLSTGTLVHGQSFIITLNGKDLADRSSNTVERTVYYDVEGPTITNVTFIPLDNTDASYVEYTTDATVEVEVDDDYSDVKEVTVIVAGISLLLTNNDGLWSGTFPSRDLFMGRHDVIVEAKDEAGNLVEKVFPKHLFVDDRLNPVIMFLFDQPYRTKNLRPSLTVNTTEEGSCTIQYVDAMDISRTIPFDNPGGRLHTVALVNDLPQEDGKEVLVDIKITCVDLSSNQAIKMGEIIVDYQPPVIGARGNDFDLILDSYDRTFKKYKVLTANDRSLHVVADEPVKCKYDIQDVDYVSMEQVMHNYEENISKENDYSERITGLPNGLHEYYVLCEDYVGNIAAVDRKVIFDVQRNSPAELVDISPQYATNTPRPQITLKTMRQLYCTGFLTTTGDRIEFVRSGSGPYTHTSSQRYNLMDGAYIYSVTCGSGTLGVATSTKQITFVKDIVAPSITITNIQDGANMETPYIELNIQISENNGNTVQATIVNDKIIWKGEVSQGVSFNKKVPLHFGNNKIRVLATDKAGNIGERSVNIYKGARTLQVAFQNLVEGSATRDMDRISAKLDNTDIENAENLVINVRDASQQLVEGTLSVDGDTAVYEFTSDLAEGNYTIEAEAKDALGMVRAYDASVFEINNFAEKLSISAPSESLISKSPYQFNGTIEYQNVIILREFILKNAHSSIKQIFNTFTTTTTPIEGNNPLYIGFENEIGHTAVIRNTIVLDRRGPIATVELKGGVGTAIGPRPVFTVLFNEPAKIRDVFVISADVAGSPNASRLSIVNDYNSNLYYLKHNFTMNEDLPTNGRYDFGIETEDEHGNVATVTYFGFNYENDPLTITLVNPEFLVSPTAAIEFTVATNRDSTCKFESQNAIYDVMRNFAVSGEQNHSVPITLSREHEGIMYYVKCNDGIGNVNEENPAIFNLSYDTSAPSISSIGIDPGVANVVIEYPLSTRIVATANEQVRCRYGEISSFESMDDFDNFTLPLFNSTSYATRNNLIDDETYTYVVICQNRAKLLSASTNVTFSVDLSQAGAIQVLSPKSGSYHTELDIPIKIKTTKRTLEGNCKWGTSEGQVYNSFDRSEENEHIHVKDSNTFPTGSNTLYFECVIEGERKKTSASFTIDMTPPAFNSIDDGDFSWNLDELSAVFNFTDNESGISKYEYAIGAKSVNGANPVEDWQSELEPKFTSSKRITVRKLDLQNLANYYWAVRAYNKAGLHTDWHSSDGVTIDTSKAPVVGSCTDGNKNQDETDIDCGGLRCTPCSEGWACVRNEDCMGRVCADGMCASGECSNGLLDGNETDVDCGGGLCSGCDLGKNCSQNLDCLQRYCNVNVCEIPACDDSVLNGWETDIDCGGDNECMRCAENSSCLVNSDCYSNLCGDDGLCLPTSCSDNIFNGDETDVDCGGSCDNCADNKGCSIDTDCSSDYCRDGRCTDRDLKDSDSDGMPDWWEIQYDLNPNDPSDADMEALAVDGMSNLEKYDYKNNEFNILGESLDPTTKDYDGDGHLDTKEIKNQTDATNNHDYPKAKWWSILLFILAIIIVGGSLGYFGYNRYIVKHKTPDVQPRVAPRQQGGPQMPKPAMKMPAKSRRMTLKEKLRLALKNKVIEERKEVLAKEHAKMLSGFGMEVSQKKLESARTLNTKIKSLKQKIKEADIDSAPESSDVEPEKPPMSPESAFDSINKYTGKDKVVEEKAGNIEKLALLSKKSSAPGKAKETIDKDGKDAVDRLTSIVSHTQKKIENNENKTDAQKKVLDKLRKIERKKSDKK